MTENDGVVALLLAADARKQRKVAQIAEVVGLAKAAEEYGVRRGDVEDAMDQIAREASVSGRIGTPRVGEFFALEAAAVLEMSPGAMFMKLHSVLAVKHRHPLMWERFLGGEIWWYEAAEVESKCMSLEPEVARRVDQIIDTARRTMPWHKVMERVPEFIAQADPEWARQQRDRRKARRYVYVDRFEAGSASFNGLLDAKDAVDFESAISAIAKDLPFPDDPDACLTTHDKQQIRRAAAVGELARSAFGQDVLPQHQLVVHIDATDPALDPEDDGTGVARIEAWGELLTEDLPRFLEGSKVTVRPVVDVRRIHPEHQHDPSASLRFALQQRNPYDVFPHGTCPATSCDLDHTVPYRDDGTPGQTHPGNLGPLSRRAHRAKTFGGFQLRQPAPGVYHWTTPHGWEFIVDEFGTRQIAEPPRTRLPKPPPDSLDPYLDPPQQIPDEPPPLEDELWPILQYELFDAEAITRYEDYLSTVPFAH